MIAVFPPGPALERKKSIGLRDLVGLPLVVMESGSSARKLVDQAFESIGDKFLSARPRYFVSNARDLPDNPGYRLLPNTPGGKEPR